MFEGEFAVLQMFADLFGESEEADTTLRVSATMGCPNCSRGSLKKANGSYTCSFCGWSR